MFGGAKSKFIISGFLSMLLVMGTFSVERVYADLEDTPNAMGVLGQVYGENPSFSPHYTKGTANNAPNNIGFPYATSSVVDTVNHWLFIGTYGRVMVWELNDSNVIEDYEADYVLGDSTSVNMYDSSNWSSGYLNLAYDQTNERLFVAEGSERYVYMFDLSGGISSGMAYSKRLGTGSSGPTIDRLSAPGAMTYSSSEEMLYVADETNNRVLAFDVRNIDNGEDAVGVIGQDDFTSSGSATTQDGLDTPYGLALRELDDYLFVSDGGSNGGNNRVMVFDVNEGYEYAVKDLQHYNGMDMYTSSYAAFGIDSDLNILYDNTGVFDDDAIEITSNNQDISAAINAGPGQQTFHMALVDCDSGTAYTTFYVDDDEFENSTALETYLTTLGISPVVDYWYDSVFTWDGSNYNFNDPGGNFYAMGSGVEDPEIAYHPAFTDGVNAVNVLGQTDFVSNGSIQSSGGLPRPIGVAYDSSRDYLFVSHVTCPGVSVFDVSTITNGEAEINIIGNSSMCSYSYPLDASHTQYPTGLYYFASGANKYVGVNDRNYYRYMIFDVTAIEDGEDAAYVVGQVDQTGDTLSPSFTIGESYSGPGPIGMEDPHDVSIDTTNHRAAVADYTNNRVLIYNLDSSDQFVDYKADYVLGQADFYSNSSSISQTGMSAPVGVEFDDDGDRLFVSQLSNRVFVYDVRAAGSEGIDLCSNGTTTTGVANGMNASCVLGKAAFNSASVWDTDISGMAGPWGIAYENDYLYVAEAYNNRVTIWDVESITNGEDAYRVIGQADFDSNGSATTATGMSFPLDVDVSDGKLFVVEQNNHRITYFDISGGITNGMSATNVFGQANLTSAVNSITQAGQSNPTAASYDSAAQRLFVSSVMINRVLVYDARSSGSASIDMCSNGTDTTGIADGMNASCIIGQSNFTSSATATTQAGLSGSRGLFFGGASDQLFVADNDNHRIMVFDAVAPNVAPTVSTAPAFVSQATDATGYVTFTVGVDDNNNDDLKVKVEYSDDDGVSWYDPFLVSVVDTSSVTDPDLNNDHLSGYQIGSNTVIDTTEGANTLTIVWDTMSAENGNGSLDGTAQSDIQVRITPNDYVLDGTATASVSFSVDDLDPSGLADLAAAGASTGSLAVTWTAVGTETNFDHYEIWYDDEATIDRGGEETEWDTTDDALLATMATTTTTITGLSTNAQYYLNIWAVDAYGNIATGVETDAYALANVPGVPTVNNAATNYLDVAIDVNGNPVGTEFAIYEQSFDGYVDADDTLQASGSEVWQTAAEWGSPVTVHLPDPNATYTFKVKARNGDGTETALSAGAGGSTLSNPPATPVVNGATASSVNVSIAGGDNPGSPAIAIQETSTTDYVQVAGTLAAGEAWQSSGAWGTKTVSSLSPNVQYTFKGKTRNDESVESSFSGTASLYTLANVPGAPTVNGATTSTLNVTLDVNSNPAATVFAIQEIGSGNYVQANGTLSGSAVWQTNATWGTVTVTGLSDDTSYSFKAKARNGDGVETALSSAGTASTEVAVVTPGTPTVDGAAATTLDVTISANGNVAEAQYLIREIGGQYVQADGTLGVAEAWQTLTNWGTPVTVTGLTANTSYTFDVKAKKDATESSYSSTAEETTLANAPGTPTVDGATTTTLDVTLDVNSNPATTELAIQDVDSGYYVQVDGSLGASAVWQTNTVWGTVTVTGLSVNTQYTFKAKARNGDTTETAFSDTAALYTLANVPTGLSMSENSASTAISVSWVANGNPSGTEYYASRTDSSFNSGWVTGVGSSDTSYRAGTQYCYNVKARNGDGVETSATSNACVTTASGVVIVPVVVTPAPAASSASSVSTEAAQSVMETINSVLNGGATTEASTTEASTTAESSTVDSTVTTETTTETQVTTQTQTQTETQTQAQTQAETQTQQVPVIDEPEYVSTEPQELIPETKVTKTEVTNKLLESLKKLVDNTTAEKKKATEAKVAEAETKATKTDISEQKDVTPKEPKKSVLDEYVPEVTMDVEVDWIKDIAAISEDLAKEVVADVVEDVVSETVVTSEPEEVSTEQTVEESADAAEVADTALEEAKKKEVRREVAKVFTEASERMVQENADADGDGVSNAEEILRGTNPHSSDSDGDGLSDTFETSIGLDSNNAENDFASVTEAVKNIVEKPSTDTDGDGLSDLVEVMSGGDPTNDKDGSDQVFGTAKAKTTSQPVLSMGTSSKTIVINSTGGVVYGSGGVPNKVMKIKTMTPKGDSIEVVAETDANGNFLVSVSPTAIGLVKNDVFVMSAEVDGKQSESIVAKVADVTINPPRVEASPYVEVMEIDEEFGQSDEVQKIAETDNVPESWTSFLIQEYVPGIIEKTKFNVSFNNMLLGILEKLAEAQNTRYVVFKGKATPNSKVMFFFQSLTTASVVISDKNGNFEITLPKEVTLQQGVEEEIHRYTGFVISEKDSAVSPSIKGLIRIQDFDKKISRIKSQY